LESAIDYQRGVNAPAPQYFVHTYVWCDDYEGELAHSCQHGKGPHHIKICITKTDNEPTVFTEIAKKAKSKPEWFIGHSGSV
jgi:hypothetical protein